MSIQSRGSREGSRGVSRSGIPRGVRPVPSKKMYMIWFQEQNNRRAALRQPLLEIFPLTNKFEIHRDRSTPHYTIAPCWDQDPFISEEARRGVWFVFVKKGRDIRQEIHSNMHIQLDKRYRVIFTHFPYNDKRGYIKCGA